MANFGWKFGAAPAPVAAPDDPTALWVAPNPFIFVFDGYFSIPYSASLVWVLDTPQTSAFS